MALFTFVARNPLTQKSTQLNPLQPQTSEEKQLFEERQQVADARRAARNASAAGQQDGNSLPGLLCAWFSRICPRHGTPKTTVIARFSAFLLPCIHKYVAILQSSASKRIVLVVQACRTASWDCSLCNTADTAAKRKWADELLAEARAMTDMPSLTSGNAMLIHDTAMQNTFVCQPQQRNIHGRVFGGFIMRYEMFCMDFQHAVDLPMKGAIKLCMAYCTAQLSCNLASVFLQYISYTRL